MAHQQPAQASGQGDHFGIRETFERNLRGRLKIDRAVPSNEPVNYGSIQVGIRKERMNHRRGQPNAGPH